MIKRILLYGNSIFLNGLMMQLENCADLQVRQHIPGAGPLRLTGFDVVIVDFDEVEAVDVLGMLRACPNVNVVGINAPCGAVTVLSGAVYLARSLDDVIGCLV